MRLEPVDVHSRFDPTVARTRLLTTPRGCARSGWRTGRSPPKGGSSRPRSGNRTARELPKPDDIEPPSPQLPDLNPVAKPVIRPRPTADTVLFKDRLLYLLQPPLEDLFAADNSSCRSSRSRTSSKASPS